MSVVSPWSIKPKAKHCSQTQLPFEAGEQMVSFLIQTDAGDIERLDVKNSQINLIKISGVILAKWMQVVKSTEHASGTSAKNKVKSAENLFLALLDEPEVNLDEQTQLERQFLKQLLALWLERKRILKPLKEKDHDGQAGRWYLHPHQTQPIFVPWVQLTADRKDLVAAALAQWL